MTFISNLPPTTYSNIKGKPYITVSAKGVNNGLSDEINDGTDFGPDTTLNATSPGQIGPPYTQTSGLYEATQYYISLAEQGIIIDLPHLMAGNYVVNAPMSPLAPSKPMSLGFIGENLTTTIITLNYSSSTAFFTIASSSLDNLESMNFRFHNFVVANTTNGSAPFFDVDFTGTSSFNANILELSDFVFANPVGNIAVNAMGFLGIECKAVENYNSTLNFNANLIEYFGYSSTGGEIIVSGKWAYLYGSNAVTINGDIDLVAIYGSGGYGGFIAIGANNQSTAFTVNTLSMRDMISGGGFGGAFIQVNMASGVTATINSLVIDNVVADLSGNTPFFSYPFGGGLTINYASISNITSMNSYIFTGIPFSSSANGTTAGTVSMQSITYMPSYKKYIITFDGYENDTTTNQTINFPRAFSSYAVVSANNTGLTISATTTGITITAPNSTTTYSGIVIVEGY